MNKEMNKEIYLAGGCFWGLEKYMAAIHGVVATDVGYANGQTKKPSYQAVCSGQTGYAETVRVEYLPEIISLSYLLTLFFQAIDPTTLDQQGPDIGSQYRSGIFYTEAADEKVIQQIIAQEQQKYRQEIVTEILPLENYYLAEDYHQEYLSKNPQGYCHISKADIAKVAKAIVDPSKYSRPTDEEIKSKLTDLQYRVAIKNQTEPPFDNQYADHFAPGIYVDIVTGEPLFSSKDKFSCSCGWPSFSKPIDPNVIQELADQSYGMKRTEVRSRVGNIHLGHVFNDGPQESGGLRYCINSAAIKFIPEKA